jgi:hypothetical protein
LSDALSVYSCRRLNFISQCGSVLELKAEQQNFARFFLAAAEHKPPSEFYLGDELSDDHREDLRKTLFDDFPEHLQPVDSPHLSRSWDHPIGTTSPMRRQRIKRLSHAEREELNRQ